MLALHRVRVAEPDVHEKSEKLVPIAKKGNQSQRGATRLADNWWFISQGAAEAREQGRGWLARGWLEDEQP